MFDFDDITREDWVDALLMIGLIALGFAAAMQVALTMSQSALITTYFIPVETQAGKMYPVLLRMKTLTDISAVVAGVTLIGGMAMANPEAARGALDVLAGTEEDDG